MNSFVDIKEVSDSEGNPIPLPIKDSDSSLLSESVNEAPAYIQNILMELVRIKKILRIKIDENHGERPPGRIAFGEKEEEKPVIQLILDMRNAQHSYTGIANKLNNDGFRTMTGKTFRPQTIKNYVLRWGIK